MRKPMWGKFVALATAFAVTCTALVATAPAEPAQALVGADFDPGYIISDELFYDGASMTAAQIQAFLDSKIGSCLTDRCLNVATVPVTSRPASYASSNGVLLCSAIEGGNLRVSELIYRTQVSCGISAKVILVTLQKEQGLITNRAPSDRALRAAMGMGCPDTAPCDDAFAGLATQIFLGSRQLIAYKAGRFARQPGVHFVQYHPNAACGGTVVNVRNYATAALYNYTPYQPNAASLANLGAVGDGCSSYGNRNFWAYYSNWFGPTTESPCTVNPSRDITTYWTDQGGASGAFGALVSPGIVAGPLGTTIATYANGDIYCTPKLGALGVLGDMRAKYLALGGVSGPLGSPIVSRGTFSAAGITGLLQDFQGGLMLSSAQTGTFAVVKGPIRDAWGLRGGSGGVLGWPIGDMTTTSSGSVQKFQNGTLVVPTGQAALVMSGEIGTYWSTGSNTAALGLPSSSPLPFTARGVTGVLQHFASGVVLSSTTTGTHAVLTGPMRSQWDGLGGVAGSLGWPTTESQALAGGQKQDFQGGTVFVSDSGVGATMTPEMATYWNSGENAARLGFPSLAPSAWTAGGVSGTLQTFASGMVLSSAQTGTFAVLNGPIRNAWGALGGSGGSMGWPTGEQQNLPGEVRQQFQRGVVTVPTGLTGTIAAYVATGSNATRLGSQTGPAAAWTAGGVSGQLQYFQKGLVLSSTTTGTYSVLIGPIRDAWAATNGSGGSLGWPTGDQRAVAGGTQQQFQRGSIIALTGGATAVLSGEIATYWSTGSNASLLGSPTGSATAWTAGGVSGQLQYFQKGWVLSSTATGTHAVLTGVIRDRWGASGGSGGSLGWPIADQQSFAGGTQQQFQKGVILAPTGGGAAVVLSGEIATFWSTGSNASLLGSPTASPSAWTANGVSGQLQYFEKGWVLSSATTGTHAVLNGPLRIAWGAQGGTGGTLGWPTGDQVSVNGAVQQAFQHGTLTISSVGVAILVTGDMYRYWSTGTNATALGSPTAPAVAWSANGVSGSYQLFTLGILLSSPTTGTFAVLDGPMRTMWGGLGGTGGSLGWPTGDRTVVAEGVRQQFQFGAIVVPPSGAPYVVAG